MKISSSYSQTAITMSVNSINNKVASKDPDGRQGGIYRDTISISPQGRKNSMLENLMKQKQQIIEQKNKLVTTTMERGGTMDSIKTQLENYEEQLNQIDQQTAELMAKEAEKAGEKADDEPKTEEEIQNERMSDLTRLSGDMEQVETISSVKERIEGEAKVKRSEISQDRANSVSSSGPDAMVSSKTGALSKLEAQASKLTSQISQRLGEVTEDIEDGNKQPVEAEKENEDHDKVNTVLAGTEQTASHVEDEPSEEA